MKKFAVIVTILLLTSAIFFLGFNYKNLSEPNTFYQVYLDDEIIGVIKSKDALERYIDQEGEHIKKKYDVNKVYAPNGLEIVKITTYDKALDSVKRVYDTIKEAKPFTIQGYQVTIRQEIESKEEDTEGEIIEKVSKYYVTKEEVFREASETMIEMYVGKEKYEAFKNDTQAKIETTGSVIVDVYVDGDKTIKETKIPVTEDIYTGADELAHDLVFGKDSSTKTYVVKLGDTIEQVAFNNQISVEEFLISNPEFTSANNLLYPNQEVVIGETNPQLSIVVQEYVVEDKESSFGFQTIEDKNMMLGEEKIEQVGKKGLDRITQTVKTVNGVINIIEPLNSEVLQAPVDQITRRGTNYIPHVGSLTSWGWPTERGWTITSPYAWRINPISGKRELHDAIDIAGPGHGSDIYAANNGTVVKASYTYINGNYIVINHNNGYYSYYGHMSRLLVKEGQVVAKGTRIGLMGDTGWATGPHVHFGIWRGYPYYGGKSYNPLNFY